MQASGGEDVVETLHGSCLGLGLAAMGTANQEVYSACEGLVSFDSAVVGEAAGLAMGLTMLGTGDGAAIDFMRKYATDTEHEKIIRGLSVGIGLVMYGKQDQADTLIEALSHDKDPILRAGAVHATAMAYAGTNSNKSIKRLLHVAVSDTSDDVRRAAVTSLGFILFRTPEQCPSVVSLLCESYNPHVRYGSCLALGIACAGTGLREAIALIEPMLMDSTPYVRQGACIAMALVMIQQPNSHPKSDSFRKTLAKTIAEKHEDSMAKFGAILAQGILEAGGRNVTIALQRGGHMRMPTVVGLLVFTQHWFWHPFAHFLSLAFTPTAVACLNVNLQMPKLDIRSNSKPSAFAYPAKLEPPKEKAKEKVETAVLSVTNKAKAKAAKKAGDKDDAPAADVSSEAAPEAAQPMDVDGGAGKEDAAEKPKTPDVPEPDFVMLANPARVVPAQLPVITIESTGRYHAVKQGPIVGCGVIILTDSTPDVAENLIVIQAAAESGTGAADGPEPEPPAPFEFNEELENAE